MYIASWRYRFAFKVSWCLNIEDLNPLLQEKNLCIFRRHVKWNWKIGWIVFIRRVLPLSRVIAARPARCIFCKRRSFVWRRRSNRYVKKMSLNRYNILLSLIYSKYRRERCKKKQWYTHEFIRLLFQIITNIFSIEFEYIFNYYTFSHFDGMLFSWKRWRKIY